MMHEIWHDRAPDDQITFTSEMRLSMGEGNALVGAEIRTLVRCPRGGDEVVVELSQTDRPERIENGELSPHDGRVFALIIADAILGHTTKHGCDCSRVALALGTVARQAEKFRRLGSDSSVEKRYAIDDLSGRTDRW